MTVYNFNQGIGWASSGVEYAQAYRAQVLRQLKIPAKFIFTDFISTENIEHFTHNLGLLDHEVIWLYLAFTDFTVAPTTFTIANLKSKFERPVVKEEAIGNRQVRYFFSDTDWVLATLAKKGSDCVQRAEWVVASKLVRCDYYSHKRYMSEYYVPSDQRAELQLRRFYNQDGSIAYDELVGEKQTESLYKFPDHLVYSKADLITEFIQRLNLTSEDVLLIDRGTGMAQQILENHGPARVGSIVHAEHYSVNQTNDHHILWNNFYEYEFQNAPEIDFFVTATAAQARTLRQQFKKYNHLEPKVAVIPVGSLFELQHPESRRPFSLITASRLAGEKHLDWLVEAVATVHNTFPQVTLDIYGEGGERANLQKLIEDRGAADYIHLMGHQDLHGVYGQYQAYASASTSEGFGLTLLEAIGAGLAMIGFDVPYGNQTFIEDGKNGVLIENPELDRDRAIPGLVNGLTELFAKLDLPAAHEASYQLADNFLAAKVEARWQDLLMEGKVHD